MNLRQWKFFLLRAENIYKTNLIRMLSVSLVANYKVENARDWLLCYDLRGILEMFIWPLSWYHTTKYDVIISKYDVTIALWRRDTCKSPANVLECFDQLIVCFWGAGRNNLLPHHHPHQPPNIFFSFHWRSLRAPSAHIKVFRFWWDYRQFWLIWPIFRWGDSHICLRSD